MKQDKLIGFNSGRDRGLTGKILFKLYGVNNNLFRKLVLKFFRILLGSNHQFYSITLRKIFKHYHEVEVGLYSTGSCFVPGAMGPGTIIGRYCSMEEGVVSINGNHPTNVVSSHAFFFNPILGYSEKNILTLTKLEIGNDVLIGCHAIILPTCAIIEDGAVIGAGVVVNKDIPAYSIAIGSPCRITGKRFSDEKIAEIRDSKWWEKSIEELLPSIENFQKPLGSN